MNFLALLVAVFYIFGQFPAEAQSGIIDNPCAYTSCAVGTTCVVVKGLARCIPHPPHHGQCPPNNGDQSTTCVFNETINCISDEQCCQSEKCCPRGCNSICVAVTEILDNPCAFTTCAVGTSCVVVKCQAQCIPLPPKPGRCPPVRYPNFGKCLGDCNNDYNCKTTFKCCPNGCSQSCQPVHNPCELIDCREGQTCVLQDVEICKRPPCNPVPTCVDVPLPITCANILCAPGYHCEQEVINCVTEPCPQPGPTCVPDKKVCTNYQCPKGQICTERTVKCFRLPCPVVAQCVNSLAT